MEWNKSIPRTVGIGIQDFAKVVTNNCFYVDKTDFIREWWESRDDVTLITRPRRFGKTLTMSMLEQFFSVAYAGQGGIFEGLSIWKDEAYRALQGTYPVLSVSFARVKEANFPDARAMLCDILRSLYSSHYYLRSSEVLSDLDREYFDRVLKPDVNNADATSALYHLSEYMCRYYGKKVIILLDEYDTPMHEAYVGGYWDELVTFSRSLFNATFKTNPFMERAVMTGITRVSRESMFSDLNNLEVVTVTSKKYTDSFGFTEEEVFAALDEFGLSDRREEVKQWYDGFVFGNRTDIYNPWSIINFLDKGNVGAYWVNTSSNSLAGKLIREGSPKLKTVMEGLLQGRTFRTLLDEQVVFSELNQGEEAVWSLLLASGYLKAVQAEFNTECLEMEYELKLTNLEVRIMFLHMIRGWFGGCRMEHNAFLQALLSDDLEGMNVYMNEVSGEMFSSFDTGKKPSAKAQPERFYHGFVLGLLAELQNRYIVTSNRESGLGRYDIMLEPKKDGDIAFVIEFKVVGEKPKETLEDGVRSALQQIEEKQYETALLSRGIAPERIRKYGFAFEGSSVLIGRG
ncbi:AAA family ATPase [uncultured Acetatifactor sp.]|uniref:AAA family ATPase n=1 Tax=uncultured Acetatifactor sp. TaxID=1671927 RepID=UPI0026210B31|nr:AAA family ATPase [uncultured Acetatifactor sp.]